MDDPKKTIQELFGNFHHNEIKEGLWEWYKIPSVKIIHHYREEMRENSSLHYWKK